MIRRLFLILMCVAGVQVCLPGENADPAGESKPEKKDETLKPVPSAIHGKIYHVDEKLKLVMIDVGSNDGVEPLMKFLVARRSRGEATLIGYIVITMVRPTASAGLIQKRITAQKFQVGDIAVKQITRYVKRSDKKE